MFNASGPADHHVGEDAPRVGIRKVALGRLVASTGEHRIAHVARDGLGPSAHSPARLHDR